MPTDYKGRWKPDPYTIYPDCKFPDNTPCTAYKYGCRCMLCTEDAYRRHRRKREKMDLTHEQRLALVWRKHGVRKSTIMDWLENPVCWVCREEIDLTSLPGFRYGPTVDHDHSCCMGAIGCEKCVRGLTHSQCNLWLGSVEKILGMVGPARFGNIVRELIEHGAT